MDTPNETRAQLVKALQALKKTRQKLEAIEAARHEPIAVVGMACRFPGAESPEAFWRLLDEGVDMIGEVPSSRWRVDDYYDPSPATPNKSYVRHGAFLHQPVDEFDAQFFGISPREAARLDPQQRLLLEVSWEALERSAIAPATLRNSRSGVFLGVSSPGEYASMLPESERTDTYTTTGNSVIFASGRLSYVLGLQGPSLVIDTACSASLIGVHLACESLRNRTSDLALAGGVHLMLSPRGHIIESQLQSLSPDGRCKTFDAAANGFGRGEGCGIVILKRLSDAIAGRDPILGLIRGSATNHDGPTSGLTVPSATAQAALIRDALANGNVEASDVSYVEAHGTGTTLGDPIEIRALASALGARSQPLLVGSVKTNIGHLEEAAGIAGLIKVILAMRHDSIPAHLHLRNPNPHIDWDRVNIRVPFMGAKWPATPNGKKIAGVSSFGMGGSNAHVVMEEAPVTIVPEQHHERPWHLLTLSAKSSAALRAMAGRYRDFVTEQPYHDLGDICFTAYTGRNHFAHRLSIVAGSAATLRTQLAEYAEGASLNLFDAPYPPKVAFLFTGQGSQYVNLGRELYETEPLFRERIDECDRVLKDCLGGSLGELLYPSAHRDLMESHPHGQAANFAVQCSFADLWRSWGVEPEVVLGDSLGEFAAAYTAGSLSLERGLRLVAERGGLMQSPTLDAFEAALGEAGLKAPKCAVVSSMTGRLVSEELADPAYWRRHPRHTVRFADGVRTLLEEGCNVFVEIGPTAALPGMESLRGLGSHTLLIPTLQEGQSDIQTLLAGAGAFYTRGGKLNWERLDGGSTRRRKLVLPTYPFQREHHAVDASANPLVMESQCGDETPLLQHLRRGNVQQLVELLGVSADLTPAAKQALPDVVRLMVQRQRAQETEATVDSWLYEVNWQPQSLPGLPFESAAAAPANESCWLILGDPEGLGEALAKQIAFYGATAQLVDAGYDWDRDRYQRLLEELPKLDGIVHLLSLSPGLASAPEIGHKGCQSVLHLVQALAHSPAVAPRLWLITRGSQPVVSADSASGFMQAAVWGLGKVIALEHPELKPVRIDLDERCSAAMQAAALAAELFVAQQPVEDQIALRDEGRYVSRLRRYKLRLPAKSSGTIRADATYLITGGLGGLGLLLAKWLAGRGARHILLMGRSGASPEVQSELAAMEALGATVRVAKADVTDPVQLTAVLAGIDHRYPLAGIVHAATTGNGALLHSQSWDAFRQAMSPKVDGAWHLDNLTQNMLLDFFVCFSSLTAVFGDLGLGAYVAANAYLDSFALYRRANGRTCVTIDWGIWSDAGTLAGADHSRLQLVQQGHGTIPSAAGMVAFRRILEQDCARVCVAPVDWAQFSAGPSAGEPFFAELVTAPVTPDDSRNFTEESPDPAPPQIDIRRKLIHALPAERPVLLAAHLSCLVANVLELPPNAPLDAGENLLALGLDSLMTVELRNLIRNAVGVNIPIDDFLRGFSIRDVVGVVLASIERTNMDPTCVPATAGVEPEWISGTI